MPSASPIVTSAIDDVPMRVRVSDQFVATSTPHSDWSIGQHTEVAPAATLSRKAPSSVRLTQRELYPARQAFSPEHITALRLLSVATGRLQLALRALIEEDDINADIETQKVQVLLPELFCCRDLGDGFGTIISAVMSAFESLKGTTPNAVQLRALHSSLETLRDRPFLSTDEADEQLEAMEVANLNPYPYELMEFLASAESVR